MFIENCPTIKCKMDTQDWLSKECSIASRDGFEESEAKWCHSWNKNKIKSKQISSSKKLVMQLTLFSLYAALLIGSLTTLIGPSLVHSVIMPPSRLLYVNHFGPKSDTGPAHLEADNEPYRLTINERNGVEVGINSQSSIIINLNKAIPELVSVKVTVNSGPNLIVFDQPQNEISEYSLPAMVKFANGTPSEYLINYNPNEFGDRPVHFHTTSFAGHAEIVCQVLKQPGNESIVIDDKLAYTSVNIYRAWFLNYIIQSVGWIYFFAWSSSFYFQVILNYKRKSVVGLNFDFLCLNLLGFACYSIFNFTLLFSYSVQQEYYKRYTYSRIPVEYNDLFFASHAFLITLVTVLQCLIYERGEQHVSLPAGIFASLASVLGLGLLVANMFGSVNILDVVLYLSYVKLVITTIKYAPQAYMNYNRKATTGWSIHNIILDFIGGSFSLLQMFLLAYNFDDWISIFGNFTKFGLGLISMLFDIVFFVQHYILYKTDGRRASLVNQSNEDLENSSDSCPSPVISQSIRSTNNPSQTVTSRNDGNVDSDDSSD